MADSDPSTLLPLLVILPLLAAMGAFLLQRQARYIGILCSVSSLVLVLLLSRQVWSQTLLQHDVGAWGPPLGISLRLDGLAAIMLLITHGVGLGISVYAHSFFADSDRRARGFWPLWLFLLGALTGLFLTGDLFNLYVTLELIAISGVSLTALDGRSPALRSALRYLVASLFGSLCYLLGVALLYHHWGSVDIQLLQAAVVPTPGSEAAFIVMTLGLMLKAAVFPLHFWLPPAHGSATAPVSALLSALVVKAGLYVIVRLWLTVFSALELAESALFTTLGCVAIIWGSLLALQQTRAKSLIAYSTVAQMGYLLLGISLVRSTGRVEALQGIVMVASAHALAKAALFMTAGNLMAIAGHDRIVDLHGAVRSLPLAGGTLALAGVSIIGLPPSGGFSGKWLLLQAAIADARWTVVATMLLGSLLAAGYVFRLLELAFDQASAHQKHAIESKQVTPFLMALCAALWALMTPPLLRLLGAGTGGMLS